EVRDYCTLENVLFNGDFPKSSFTIYEMLSGERTVCIFDFTSRGATQAIRVPVKTLWYLKTQDKDEQTWDLMDQNAADAFADAYLGGGGLPRYCFVWMPGVDHPSHFNGPKHPVVRNRVRAVDRHVGRMAEVLQKAGIYDKTVIAFTADHGLRDNSRHL